TMQSILCRHIEAGHEGMVKIFCDNAPEAVYDVIKKDDGQIICNALRHEKPKPAVIVLLKHLPELQDIKAIRTAINEDKPLQDALGVRPQSALIGLLKEARDERKQQLAVRSTGAAMQPSLLRRLFGRC